MGLPVKKPKIQCLSKREKVWKYMELRGIVDWIEAKLDMYYKPVASVPDAPNFIELMGLEVTKEELLELLIDICAGYWERESELDEALEVLETRVGKKLMDRGTFAKTEYDFRSVHKNKTRSENGRVQALRVALTFYVCFVVSPSRLHKLVLEFSASILSQKSAT